MKSSTIVLPSFYRNFALVFLTVAVIFLISVSYVVWANVTVLITPTGEAKEYTVHFSVSPNTKDLENSMVEGVMNQFSLEHEQTFVATGEQEIAQNSGVIGKVTIINNYSKDQTLVANTRLAKADAPTTTLARLQNTVTVPAGSRLEVVVYTDTAAEAFEPIAPGKFVIPGLWEPLWEHIYAENQQTLQFSGFTVPVVTTVDLDTARKALTDALYTQASEQANEVVVGRQSLWPKLVSVPTTDAVLSAQGGDQIAEFSGSMRATTTVIAFDEQAVIDLAKEKLSTEGVKINTLNPKNFSYTLLSYDPQTMVAEVSLVFTAVGNSTANVEEKFNKKELYGKTEEEVKAYFSQFSEIETVEVQFFPSWLKKMPRLENKIKIEIVN